MRIEGGRIVKGRVTKGAILGVAVLFVATAAWASIPDSSGVIHGCYRTGPGSPSQIGLLRVIDTEAGQSCARNEVSLTWNQAGPEGTQGPTGPQGATGATGATGAQGPSGAGGASTNFIDLQLFGARIFGGANFTTGFGQHGGLQLPSTSSVSGFDFQFTIPPDYTTGNTLTVRVVWHTSATDCQMFLRENSVSVARVGRAHIIGEFASTGLESVGGDLLQAPSTPNVTQQKLYTINSPIPATPLQAGDNVIFGLFRDLREGHEDTCAANLTVQGVSIVY
jgi:hypothetical protein